MSKVSITRSKLDSLADAIGSKSSQGIPLTIDQMRDAVLNIETGITPSGTKNITKNGTYDVTKYANTEVNIQPKLQTKSIHPSTESQTVTPDSNYDGLSNVSVEAMTLREATVTPSDKTQVTTKNVYELLGTVKFDEATAESAPSNQGAIFIDEDNNLLELPLGYQTAIVGSIVIRYQETGSTLYAQRTYIFNEELSVPQAGSFNYGVEDSTVDDVKFDFLYVRFEQNDAGAWEAHLGFGPDWTNGNFYYISGKVEIYKITTYDGLSQVTVNPIPSEYIVPTGELGITQNGTIDVTQYASVNVSVPAGGSAYQDEDGYIVLGEGESSVPQGNLSITANGTYDVAQYAGASVEVPVGMTKTQLKNFIERSSSFTDIDWPDGITQIGKYAFAECRSFKPSSLPSGITSIENNAFYACTSLSLTGLPSGVTYIGPDAFYSCINLALTSLPSGLTTIYQNMFRGCERLALTELPSNITFIGDSAFMGCHSLALTSLPSGLVDIRNNAFQYCNGLTSITCEGAITTLGSYAFNGNSTYPMALTSASFPNMALASNILYVFGSTTAACACQQLEFCDIGSTTGIGSNAFANCHALETLVLRKTASVCTLASVGAFTNTPMRGYNSLTGKVYVPSALISSYQTATNWSTLYDAGTVEFVAIEGSEYER